MPDLSADQRAILDLIVDRDLDYEGVGDVTGIGAAAARVRARAGLEALGAGEPDQDLADFLLGRVSPDAGVRARLESEPAYNTLAQRIAARIRTEFPEASTPSIPGVARPRTQPRARRFPIGFAAAGAGVLCMIVAVLAFAGVFSGDDDEEPAATPEEVVEPSEPVEVSFESPNGGEATGTATIGLGADSEPFLQLDVSKLPQAPAGEIYMLWVDDGLGRGLPLPSPLKISKDGALRQGFRVAAELIPILDLGKNLELITVGSEQLQQLSSAVVQAGKDAAGDEAPRPEDLPERPGGVVLTGEIPDG